MKILTPGVLTDELAALFKCSTCFEVVLPPVIQCQVRHLVRSHCRSKLSCSPVCRGTLGDARNLAMKNVANSGTFPCKHKQTDCRVGLGINKKVQHEEMYRLRSYSCVHCILDKLNWKKS